MTTFTRFRCVAAGTIFMAAVAGSMAPAAFAAAPTITITAPGEEIALSAFPVSALVTMPTSQDKIVGPIRFNLTAVDPRFSQETVKAEVPGNGTNRQNVSFNVALAYNGKYEATVLATGRDGGPLAIQGINEDETSSASRQFSVAAPPAMPADVRAVVDKESRVVTLRWDANTEKDMLFYLVQRAKGDGGYTPLGKTEGAGDTSVVDPSTAEAPGDYRYQVVAVRRGPSDGKVVNSAPSRAATVSVSGPPGPGAGSTSASTTPGSGTGTGAGDGSTTTGTTLAPNSPGALKTSGTLDLSGFSGIKNRASRSGARSEEPDPGFRQTLPFDSTTNTTRLVGADEQASAPEGDDSEVRELGAEDASAAQRKSAGFLAGGLLATVLLMHLLWIKGEVQREPLEALVPE